MDVETRQSAFAVWGLLLFWLNGTAFVLLGLQFPALLSAVRDQFSLAQLLGFTAVVAGVATAVSRMRERSIDDGDDGAVV
jgi:CPA1 family monovalent cation:H+ antiporter